MREEILALLLAAFTGVRKDGLNQLARTLALQVTNKDEAKVLVDKLTKAQVDEFVKDYRADVDKEVSESKKTIESNLKKKMGDDDGKKPVPGGDDDIETRIATAVAAALAPFQKGEIAKSRLQMLTDKLATCKDETFKAQSLKDFARMSFDTDDAFNEYLTDKETDILAANQSMADNDLRDQGAPLFSNTGADGVSQAVTDFIKSQSPETNDLAGKEV